MTQMLGVIGGTGLYAMEGLELERELTVETPFGKPSAPIMVGRFRDAPAGGPSIAFLPRHGRQHGFLPSEINYRANLWALKEAGARHVLSVSATGSLREEIRPGDLVLPSQYIDWTRGKRVASYLGDGMIGHVSSAEPVCPGLAGAVAESARRHDLKLHRDKTYVCVEGPRFGTRAESFMLRTMGADIVGMTNVPEAFLAREACLSYATLAVATDYDCWMEDPSQHATMDKVIALYKQTLGKVQQIIRGLVAQPLPARPPLVAGALTGALTTPEADLSAEKRAWLEFLRR